MFLLAAALTIDQAPPARTSPAAVDAACPAARPHVAVQRDKAPPLKKLNELPPGNMYKAVYRRIDGCEVPVVVRYDIGRR